MTSELVSIITPTYNSASCIGSTYRSIQSQSHINWEWLITDDCSSDDTYLLLQKMSELDDRIKIFRHGKNRGAAEARNCSISHASGEYLAFIDADDLWYSSKLEKQINFMGGGISFSFTAYELIDESGYDLGKKVDFGQTGSFSYSEMLRKEATLGCSTVMLRRGDFTDLSMPLLRTGQDYALWLKLLKTGREAYILGEVLTKYRIVPNSISRNKLKKAIRQWQIYRDVEGLNFVLSCICFFSYVRRAVFRR